VGATGDDLDALLGLGGGRVVAASERPGGVGPGPSGWRGAGLVVLPVQAIRPSSFQPRTIFGDGELDELADSISQVGVLQPVIVRPVDGGRYELVAGERRWRAAQRAGLTEVPAIVRDVDDRGSLEQAVVENLHRVDLNPLEEAAAYRQLVDEFSLSQEEVARRVGKSRSAVANAMRLLHLPGAVQRLIRTGELTAGHARALLALSDGGEQLSLAVRAVADGLSVREIEDLVRQLSTRTGGDASAVRRAGPRPKAASVLEIERLLADRLDTTVNVSLVGSRGRLVIEFADLEDLDRVYQALAGTEDRSD
jgi:ParB family chromosome partitioning protein